MKIKKLDFAIDISKINFEKLNLETDIKKMFGKMGRLLKDRRWVRFKILLQFDRDGNEKSTTISMEGERSASGGWNTSFPQAQNSRMFESPEILRERLSSVEESVRSYVVENALDKEWTQMEGDLREDMKSGVSTNFLEYRSAVPVQALASRAYKAHLYAPLMAIAYVIEGVDALEKNDLNHASHCVDRGLHWSSPTILIPNPNDRFKERAANGGHGKAKLRDPVKDKVAELLSELAPEEGWKSTTDAIDAVSLMLIDNHSAFVEERLLTPENLPRAIGDWIRADPNQFPHRIRLKA